MVAIVIRQWHQQFPRRSPLQKQIKFPVTINPLNTSWARNRSHGSGSTKKEPIFGEFSCKGGGGPWPSKPRVFQSPYIPSYPPKLIWAQNSSQNQRYGPGPKLIFFVRCFHRELGPNFRITDILQKQVKIDDSFC